VVQAEDRKAHASSLIGAPALTGEQLLNETIPSL
jgi:hypothetical protein